MIRRVLSLALCLCLPFALAAPAAAADPPTLANRLGSLPGDLIEQKKTDPEVVEALFLSTVARLPTQAQQDFAVKHLKGAANREEAVRDVLWTLVNSSEFLQLHGLNKDLGAAIDFTGAVTKSWDKK